MLHWKNVFCTEKKNPRTAMGGKNPPHRFASAVKKTRFQSMFEELGWLHKAQLLRENLMAFFEKMKDIFSTIAAIKCLERKDIGLLLSETV